MNFTQPQVKQIIEQIVQEKDGLNLILKTKFRSIL